MTKLLPESLNNMAYLLQDYQVSRIDSEFEISQDNRDERRAWTSLNQSAFSAIDREPRE